MPITIDKRSIPGTDWSGLGESIRASGNRLADRSREEARYQEAQRQKREAEFLQMANVDPVSIISDNLQKKQADNIQQFISMAGEEYRSSNYRPTTLQKLKIQQAKNKLQSWQQSILSNQKMWQQAYDTIQQDKLKGTYDAGNFWEKTQEFNDTGQLPGDLLLPREYGDIGKVFLDKKYSGKVIRKRNTVDANGRYTTTEVEEVADENERKSHMIGDIFDDVRLQYTISKQFNKLPPEVKQEYLNRYPNDQGNAITDWAYDTYKDFYAPKVKEINTGDIRSGGRTATAPYHIPYNPENAITIGIGKYSKEAKPTLGNKDITSQVDRYDGYAFPQAFAGSITDRPHWNLKTAQKVKPTIGGSISLKNPTVFYMPTAGENHLATNTLNTKKSDWRTNPTYIKNYIDKNRNLKAGYKLKAILFTAPDDVNNKMIDLTPEVKAELITRWPDQKDFIESIELSKTLDEVEGYDKSLNQNEEASQFETKTYTIGGQTYTHDELIEAGYSENKIQQAIKAGKIK